MTRKSANFILFIFYKYKKLFSKANYIFKKFASTYHKLDKGERNMFGKNCCCNQQMMRGCCRQPQIEQCVMEPTITKCVEQEIYHEVPQE